MDNGLLTIKMDNDKLTMDNGQWTIDNVLWTINNGQRALVNVK